MAQKMKRGKGFYGWPDTMPALKRKVRKVWKSFDQESFRKLPEKYRAMLEVVVDKEGGRVPRLWDLSLSFAADPTWVTGDFSLDNDG